jgi:hypothetical protein
MLPEAENILSDAVEDAVIQKYFLQSLSHQGERRALLLTQLQDMNIACWFGLSQIATNLYFRKSPMHLNNI